MPWIFLWSSWPNKKHTGYGRANKVASFVVSEHHACISVRNTTELCFLFWPTDTRTQVNECRIWSGISQGAKMWKLEISPLNTDTDFGQAAGWKIKILLAGALHVYVFLSLAHHSVDNSAKQCSLCFLPLFKFAKDCLCVCFHVHRKINQGKLANKDVICNVSAVFSIKQKGAVERGGVWITAP